MKRWLLLVVLIIASCAPAPAVVVQNVSQDRQATLPEIDAPEKLQNLVSKTPTTFQVNWSTGNNTMTVYVSPEGLRVDAKEPLNNKLISTRTIATANQTISCSKKDEWQCFKIKKQYDSSMAGLLKSRHLEEANISAARTRSILGLKAECFILTTIEGTEEVCYNADGIPLYLQSGISGTMKTWQAASFSVDVPEEYLNPPATPQEVRDELSSFVTE